MIIIVIRCGEGLLVRGLCCVVVQQREMRAHYYGRRIVNCCRQPLQTTKDPSNCTFSRIAVILELEGTILLVYTREKA